MQRVRTLRSTASAAFDPSPTPATQTAPGVRRTAAMLLPLQLFLAAGWLRAGVEKVIDADWWTGDGLLGFLSEQEAEMLPFFGPFATQVLDPLSMPVAILVLVLQLTVGALLVVNRRVVTALWIGIAMNVFFTMAGRVNPSVFYLVMQATLLFALSRPVALKAAVRRCTALLVIAAAFAPFARTLHPSEVIEDSALILSFVALLSAVTTMALAYERPRPTLNS